jgi:hypothetical protein
MDAIILLINNGYNPFTGQGGLGYKPPKFYGHGGLGYKPPFEGRIHGGQFELVKYNPESKRNDLTISYGGKPPETYELMSTQPTGFLWDAYLSPETSIDDKSIIISTIEKRKQEFPEEYNKQLINYNKRLDESKKELVINSNTRLNELKYKNSELYKKYFPEKKTKEEKPQTMSPEETLAKRMTTKVKAPAPIVLNIKRKQNNQNELIINFNNVIGEKTHGLDNRITNYEKTPNATNKSILIKSYKDTIKYGLDLVIKNPNIITTKISDAIISFKDDLNNLITKGPKYEIENNVLVEGEKEKPTKSDTVYKQLVAQREDYETISSKEWKKFKKNNEELVEKYDELHLGDLDNKIEELENGTYTKPEEFDAPNCDEFEEKFKNVAVVKKFLKQMVPDFDEKKLSEFVIIQTETDYNNITFDGKTFSFKKDKFFPMDVIVLTKLKNGTIKKYAIELKYYDNTPYYTGLENEKTGKVAESGTKVSFLQLCELQQGLYDDYKKSKVSLISKLNDKIEDEEDKPESIRDNNKIIKFKKEIEELTNLIDNNEKLNEDFNKNIYGYCVAMKFSKGGFDFQNKQTDIGDYNSNETYKHLQQFNVKQNILKVQVDGKIDNIISGKSKKENTKYSIMKDSEILYGISMSDAILGLNYSQEIRNNNKLIDNPFYSHHLYKSSYGKYTDSIGLKLEKFKLIK